MVKKDWGLIRKINPAIEPVFKSLDETEGKLLDKVKKLQVGGLTAEESQKLQSDITSLNRSRVILTSILGTGMRASLETINQLYGDTLKGHITKTKQEHQSKAKKIKGRDVGKIDDKFRREILRSGLIELKEYEDALKVTDATDEELENLIGKHEKRLSKLKIRPDFDPKKIKDEETEGDITVGQAIETLATGVEGITQEQIDYLKRDPHVLRRVKSAEVEMRESFQSARMKLGHTISTRASYYSPSYIIDLYENMIAFLAEKRGELNVANVFGVMEDLGIGLESKFAKELNLERILGSTPSEYLDAIGVKMTPDRMGEKIKVRAEELELAGTDRPDKRRITVEEQKAKRHELLSGMFGLKKIEEETGITSFLQQSGEEMRGSIDSIGEEFSSSRMFIEDHAQNLADNILQYADKATSTLYKQEGEFHGNVIGQWRGAINEGFDNLTEGAKDLLRRRHELIKELRLPPSLRTRSLPQIQEELTDVQSELTSILDGMDKRTAAHILGGLGVTIGSKELEEAGYTQEFLKGFDANIPKPPTHDIFAGEMQMLHGKRVQIYGSDYLRSLSGTGIDPAFFGHYLADDTRTTGHHAKLLQDYASGYAEAIDDIFTTGKDPEEIAKKHGISEDFINKILGVDKIEDLPQLGFDPFLEFLEDKGIQNIDQIKFMKGQLFDPSKIDADTIAGSLVGLSDEEQKTVLDNLENMIKYKESLKTAKLFPQEFKEMDMGDKTPEQFLSDRLFGARSEAEQESNLRNLKQIHDIVEREGLAIREPPPTLHQRKREAYPSVSTEGFGGEGCCGQILTYLNQLVSLATAIVTILASFGSGIWQAFDEISSPKKLTVDSKDVKESIKSGLIEAIKENDIYTKSFFKPSTFRTPEIRRQELQKYKDIKQDWEYDARAMQAAFVGADVAHQMSMAIAKGGVFNFQQLYGQRGYDRLLSEGLHGAQLTLPLHEFGVDVRKGIGHAIEKALEEESFTITEQFHYVEGDIANRYTDRIVEQDVDALQPATGSSAFQSARIEGVVKLAARKGYSKDEIYNLIKKQLPEQFHKPFEQAWQKAEYHGTLDETIERDTRLGIASQHFEEQALKWDKVAGRLNSVRQLTVELNMSMLGLMFSALSFISILTQGITQLLTPLQDLESTFKSLGMAIAFGGKNAQRLVADFNPQQIIKGWMDLQGVMASFQLMMANLSTTLLDAGFFEMLDDSIGLLADTLSKPENIELFASLIEQLIRAIPSMIWALEKVLNWVESINSVLEGIGVNIFGIIGAAGLIGMILLPIFAIINSIFQAINFFGGILLANLAKQILYLNVIKAQYEGIASVKNVMAHGAKRWALGIATVTSGLYAALLLMRAISGEKDDMDVDYQQKIRFQDDDTTSIFERIRDSLFSIDTMLQVLTASTLIYYAKLAAQAVKSWYTDSITSAAVVDLKAMTHKGHVLGNAHRKKQQTWWGTVQTQLNRLIVGQKEAVAANASGNKLGGLLAVGSLKLLAVVGVIAGILSAIYFLYRRQADTAQYIYITNVEGDLTTSRSDRKPFGQKVQDFLNNINVRGKIGQGIMDPLGRIIQTNPMDFIFASTMPELMKSARGLFDITASANQDFDTIPGYENLNLLEIIANNTKKTADETDNLNDTLDRVIWRTGFDKTTSGMTVGGTDGDSKGLLETLAELFGGILEAIFGLFKDGFSLWDLVRDWLGIEEDQGFWSWLWRRILNWIGVPESEGFWSWIWGRVRAWLGVPEGEGFWSWLWNRLTSWIGVPEGEGVFAYLRRKVIEWIGNIPSIQLMTQLVGMVWNWIGRRPEGSLLRQIYDRVMEMFGLGGSAKGTHINLASASRDDPFHIRHAEHPAYAGRQGMGIESSLDDNTIKLLTQFLEKFAEVELDGEDMSELLVNLNEVILESSDVGDAIQNITDLFGGMNIEITGDVDDMKGKLIKSFEHINKEVEENMDDVEAHFIDTAEKSAKSMEQMNKTWKAGLEIWEKETKAAIQRAISHTQSLVTS